MDFEGGFVFAPIFTHNPFLSAPTLPPLLPSLISNHQVLQQMALGSITTAAAAGHGGGPPGEHT